MILIVTGTPGTGKSSFSKKLATKLGLRYISINDIIFKNNLVKGYDEMRKSYIVDEEAAQSYIIKMLKEEDDLVFDGHNAVHIIPCNYVDYCIVLRCDPYILWDRLIDKRFDEDKVRENVQAEILDIILIEAIEKCGDKVIQLDASRNFDDKLDCFIKMLGGEEESCYDKIDWLGYITEKGDLKRFFPS